MDRPASSGLGAEGLHLKVGHCDIKIALPSLNEKKANFICTFYLLSDIIRQWLLSENVCLNKLSLFILIFIAIQASDLARPGPPA